MYLPSNNVKVFPIANRSVEGANTLTEANLTFLSKSLCMGSNGFVYELNDIPATTDTPSTLEVSFSLAGYSFKVVIPKSELATDDIKIYASISISDKWQIQGLDDAADGKYKGLNIVSINKDETYEGQGKYLLIAEKSNGKWNIPTTSLFINQLISGIDGKR